MNIYLEIALTMMVGSFVTCMMVAICAASDMLMENPPKRNVNLLKLLALIYVIIMAGALIAGVFVEHSL